MYHGQLRRDNFSTWLRAERRPQPTISGVRSFQGVRNWGYSSVLHSQSVASLTVCELVLYQNRGGSQEIRNIVIVCSVMYLPVESGLENRNITEIVLSLGNSSYAQNSPFLSTFSTRASPRRFVSTMAGQAISPTPRWLARQLVFNTANPFSPITISYLSRADQ